MIRDYSKVPSTKLIENNTDNLVKFDLRDDWKQVQIELDTNQSVKVTVETSDAMAILDNKIKDLKLVMQDVEEPEEPEEEYELAETVNTSGNTYRFTFRAVPTRTMTEVMLGDGAGIKRCSISDCASWNSETKFNVLQVGIGKGDIGFGCAKHIYDEQSDTAYNLVYIFLTTEEIEQSGGELQFSEENPTTGWYLWDTRDMIFTPTDVPQPIDVQVVHIENYDGDRYVDINEFNVSEMDYLFEKVQLIELANNA